MSEEEIVNRFLNMIATKYDGGLARQFENQYILKDKEIERLNNIINEINNAFEDKNIHNNMELVRKIKNILKEVDKE